MHLIQKILSGDVGLILSLAAILIMLYCLWLVLSLKQQIPGGLVGKQWNILTMLVVLFTIGYFTTPFFGTLDEALLRHIVYVIFVFGAIYVVFTVRLIHRVIRELVEE